MTDIEPLATLITYLRDDPALLALTAGRIHGGERPLDARGAALTASLDGGDDSELPLSDVRVEVRCWGGSGPDGPARAVRIWRALRERTGVAHTPVGDAHLLWLRQAGGPVLLRDPNDEAFVRGELRLATADTALGA